MRTRSDKFTGIEMGRSSLPTGSDSSCRKKQGSKDGFGLSPVNLLSNVFRFYIKGSHSDHKVTFLFPSFGLIYEEHPHLQSTNWCFGSKEAFNSTVKKVNRYQCRNNLSTYVSLILNHKLHGLISITNLINTGLRGNTN